MPGKRRIDWSSLFAKGTKKGLPDFVYSCFQQTEFEEFRHCLQTRPLVLLKLEDCKAHKFKFRNCMARNDKELETAAEFRDKVWKVEKEQ
mmetsp:Transcript_28680/g.111942  ORF Transcript_28680/g.111942 Transcript_28680/m.111942 type:complete len:90 (-) Transcript_28680:247-516(-)